MARTKEFEEHQALDDAMHAFWRNGYGGTSVQVLEKATGLSRTSLYNTFGNKRELFERVLVHYRETILIEMLMELDSTPDIREGVRRMLSKGLDMHFDEDNPGGCLVVLSLLESEQHNEQSRALLEQTVSELRKALQQRLKKAQKDGLLSKQLDSSAVATTISSTMAGTMVMGKAGFSKTMLKKVVGQLLNLIH